MIVKTNPNYKIGLYIRNSDQKQDTEEGTIKNQECRLREYVKIRNLSGNFGEIIGIYVDRSLSGKDMNRPELQSLMDDVSSKKINLILVSELSRISRDMRDFLDFWELLKDNNCSFLSLRENVDTSNAAGEMVLRTIVNIAQFEREQTRERVIANHKSRAKRGLYNGGTIPFGYRKVEDKPGYLDIDPQRAKTVQKIFDAFIKHETLSATAKWLNKQEDIKLDRQVQGGGLQVRLDQFTCDNLQHILRNKAYKGVRDYKDGDGRGEAPAVWEPIVSVSIFDRVQEILGKNHSRRKPFTEQRWPYTLSGLTYCLACKDVICGKSAHGRHKKYGYYEHSWASKKGSTFAKGTLKCEPHRVPAKKLEEAVYDNVEQLLHHPSFAQKLIKEAKKVHKNNSTQRKISSLSKRIIGYEGLEEALAERLAELPPEVSATPIFKQLEKLQNSKAEAQDRLQELKSNRVHTTEIPASLNDYEAFLKLVKEGFNQSSAAEWRSKLLKRLIHKIEVGTDRIRIHYYAGCNRINILSGAQTPIFFENGGSSTLTSGAGEGT